MESDKKKVEGKLKILESRGLIETQVRLTSEEIQSIKLKNETQQKETRVEEEVRRQQRYQEIQQEAIQSGKKNAALEMKWAELKELEECEELDRQIKKQIESFNDIINGKDKLIKEFWTELKKKDDDYVKMLKKQSNDIKEMIGNMRKQFFEIRERNLQELEEIEKAFEQERRNMIKTHQQEIELLFEKHANLEQTYVEKRDNQEEEFTKKIEELRIKGQKDFAELKINMEGEIQNLEKCLEDMKALYILNTEKLDYNLKVLKEKDDENTHLYDELKKKDQNLNNTLRKLTKDYIDKDKQFKNENKLRTQEYKRITRQFKELQRKFKHFEKADLDRYTEIQTMNEEEVRKFKDKIIKCDITVHIQQLGMQWNPPKTEEEQNNPDEMHHQSAEKSKLQGSQQQEGENQEEEEEKFCVKEDRLAQVMGMLMEEVDFLLDDRLREKLHEYPEHEQISQKLETIKKCIGIDSIAEINMFITEFIMKCRVRKPEEVQQPQEDDDGQQKDKDKDQQKEDKKDEKEGKKKKEKKEVELPKEEDQPKVEEPINLDEVELDQNYVIDFLMDWMNTRDDRKKKLEMMSTKKHIKQETEREKKERIARVGKKYWEKLTQVLPETTFRVWKVLDKALSKYYQLLLSRQKLIEETGELHNQNEELKNLLNQYLQINHELIIPPTRLINLEMNK